MENSVSDLKKDIAEQFSNSKEIFDLLGDQTRMQIIILLLENKNREMTVEKITSAVYLSRPAVSHHLKALKNSGILKMRKESVYNYYSLNKETPIWNELCSLFRKVNDLITMEDFPVEKNVLTDNSQ